MEEQVNKLQDMLIELEELNSSSYTHFGHSYLYSPTKIFVNKSRLKNEISTIIPGLAGMFWGDPKRESVVEVEYFRVTFKDGKILNIIGNKDKFKEFMNIKL